MARQIGHRSVSQLESEKQNLEVSIVDLQKELDSIDCLNLKDFDNFGEL